MPGQRQVCLAGSGTPEKRNMAIQEGLRERILRLFVEMDKDTLDLHVLFEAAGNDPAEREKVLDALEELVRDELLETRGNDFYALTSKGRRSIHGN
jgi:hypothetical protein